MTQLVLGMYSLPLPLKVFEVSNMTEYMTSQGNIAKDLAGSSSIVICMSCELKEPERLPTFSNETKWQTYEKSRG